MISTMGTHSSGHPSRKIIAMIMIRINVGERSHASRNSVINPHPPNRENTPPKKLDAATRNRINTEISSVFTSASNRRGAVSWR